ncbi:MAG: hypothetical protein JO053_04260 [Acidobacteria bacterium]|nr:hypothetical protein [Acidobacteriota bacterium]
MRKVVFCLIVTAFSLMMFTQGTAAQRASVSVAEVTGTFQHKFGARYKNSASEIKIASIGKGRLRVVMHLLYPYIVKGDLMANLGELDAEATITGDRAFVMSPEMQRCTIEIVFVRPGTIKVTQTGDDSDCGFGHNVTATGTYTRTSSRKPNF